VAVRFLEGFPNPTSLASAARILMGSEHISVATPFKAHPQPEMRLLAFGLDFSTLDIHFRRKLLPNIQIMAGAAEGMLAHSMRCRRRRE